MCTSQPSIVRMRNDVLIYKAHQICVQTPWELVCIDTLLPEDRRPRYDVIHGEQKIGMPFHSLRLYHHFGGQMPDVHFICKIPDSLFLPVDGASTNVTNLINGLPETMKVYEQVKKLSRPMAHAQMARALERR